MSDFRGVNVYQFAAEVILKKRTGERPQFVHPVLAEGEEVELRYEAGRYLLRVSNGDEVELSESAFDKLLLEYDRLNHLSQDHSGG